MTLMELLFLFRLQYPGKWTSPRLAATKSKLKFATRFPWRPRSRTTLFARHSSPWHFARPVGGYCSRFWLDPKSLIIGIICLFFVGILLPDMRLQIPSAVCRGCSSPVSAGSDAKSPGSGVSQLSSQNPINVLFCFFSLFCFVLSFLYLSLNKSQNGNGTDFPTEDETHGRWREEPVYCQ